MSKRKHHYVIWSIVTVLLLGLIFQDFLLQTYVRLFHGRLETYATTFLAEARSENPFDYGLWAEDGNLDAYGPWETTCWSERGAVEFATSAFGIAPSTHYKGFYYSEDNSHMPFQATDLAMTENGDVATWTWQGNYGSSTRICDHWFWFEAHF